MTAVNGELQDRPPFNNEAAAPVPPVPTPEPATAGQVTCNRKCKGKNMAEPGRKGCRKCLDYDKAIRKTPKTNKNDGSLAGGNNAAAAATQTPAGPSHSPLGGNPDQITASSTSPAAGHQRMQVSPASPYSLQHVGGVGPQVPRGTDTAAGAGQSFFGHRNQISGSPMPPIMCRHTIHASPVSRNVAQPAGDVFSHGLPGTHDFAGARESFFGNRNRILGSPMSPIPYHHTIHAAPAFRDLAQPPVDSFAHGLPGTHDAAGTRESLFGRHHQPRGSPTNPTAGHHRMHVSPASPNSLQPVGGVGSQVPRGIHTADGAGQSFFGHRNQISGSPMPPIVYRHTIHAAPTSSNVAQPTGDVFAHGLLSTHDAASARESFLGRRHQTLGSPMFPIGPHGNRQGLRLPPVTLRLAILLHRTLLEVRTVLVAWMTLVLVPRTQMPDSRVPALPPLSKRAILPGPILSRPSKPLDLELDRERLGELVRSMRRIFSDHSITINFGRLFRISRTRCCWTCGSSR
jgi:hypothetical protein